MPLRFLPSMRCRLDATDAIDIRCLIKVLACIVPGKYTSFMHLSIVFSYKWPLLNANKSGIVQKAQRANSTQAPTQSCEEAGVMPSTVAMAGLYEVNEVFKYLLDIGKSQINSLFRLNVDTLSNEQNQFFL